MKPPSQKWGYIRIMTGTILGGILGFYVMHRLESNYKVTIPSLSSLFSIASSASSILWLSQATQWRLARIF